MKADKTCPAKGKASALVLVVMMQACVVEAEEGDALDATELSWSDSPSEDDVSVSAPTSITRREVPDRRNGLLHLQPCYEVGQPCGQGELVCTETEWGLYCMQPYEDPFLGGPIVTAN